MTKIKREFIYNLLETFQYSFKGETRDAKFITLKSPTSKHIELCAPLKQAFFRSIPTGRDATVARDAAANLDSEKPEKDDKEADGESILMMISMSKDVDYGNFLRDAKKLFGTKQVPGIAYIEGEEPMNSVRIDRMSIEDIENMTGQYLANFILASALKKMNEG